MSEVSRFYLRSLQASRFRRSGRTSTEVLNRLARIIQKIMVEAVQGSPFSRPRFGFKGGDMDQAPSNTANEFTYLGTPSPQAMIDIVPGWTSRFPESYAVTAGTIPLFEDTRVVWALNILGGTLDKTVLELGPLEGGHTYMLHKAGARSIKAIEANSKCFLKCLITKEVTRMPGSVSFIFGNFIPWLEGNMEVFDIVWAAGVMYHLTRPVEFLHLLGRSARAIHIWTHYVPDNDAEITGGWSDAFTGKENVEFGGLGTEHFIKAYGEERNTAAYCGGLLQHACWIRRSDILKNLASAGFSQVEIAFEDVNHPHGPCFAIAAKK